MIIKSVLVTGGAGYVGAVLIPKLLKKGYKVTVLDWYIYGDVLPRDKNLTKVKGDLRDKKIIKQVLSGMDAVIHLACISNDPSFELDPRLGRSINYDATKDLFDLSLEKGVKRFVYASSSSVYGVKKEKEVTENLPLNPLTDYSKYKALSEKYLFKKTTGEITLLILRPSTVCGYSPRMRFDLTVNLLTIQALVNKKIKVFGGDQKRPNIHIEDMADAYVKSLEYENKKIDRKIYNVGYENYTVLEIAKMVVKTLNDQRIKIEILPTKDPRSYHVSSALIKKELGFSACHSVEEAIRDIKKAYESGKFKNPLNNSRYYNIKTMQEIELN